MRGIFSWPVFRVAEVCYSLPGRVVGKSRFRMKELASLAGDGIIAFSLRFLTLTGFLVAAGAFVYLLFIIIRALVMGIDEPGYASILSVILFFNGLAMAGTGVLGEYVGRIHAEVRARPIYVVRTVSRGKPGA